ncbi:MAG: TerC family protein [Chloroflexi bacterium]|nr:TerC family protein [Chloroflexota bacterium]
MDPELTQNLIALGTLFILEVVLGIDNVIFLAILAAKLPAEQQERARRLGIGLAVITRIILLFAINWVQQATETWFTIANNAISGKDVVLLIGGMFLIGKSTHEIHNKLEGEEKGHGGAAKAAATMASVLIQVMIVDMVFSLDSVITAVGISGVMWVMITAILAAAVVMVLFAGTISRFVEKHPTTKILALAFLILIGALLVIEGWNPEAAHELHLKNYAYFAMAFSFIVEIVNIRVRKQVEPVHLHNQPTMTELQATVAKLQAENARLAAGMGAGKGMGTRPQTGNSKRKRR